MAVVLSGMAAATDSVPWAVLAVLLALLVVPPLVVALTMPMMGVGMMGWGMGQGAVSPLVAVVWGLVPVVLLLGVAYLAYRAFAGGGLADGRDPAVEELRLAFARGDLSREEFEERMELLDREG